MKKPIAKRLLICLVAFGVFVSMSIGAREAVACTCLKPTVESSYNMSTDVVTARPLYTLTVGTSRWYLARVGKVYKGCLDAGDWVLVTTATSSASCGAQFVLGRDYLFNGQGNGSLLGVPRIGVTLCGYNLQTSDLTAADRAFLNGRNVCCGDDCQCAHGTDPVLCLVDPCSVAPPCAEGKCVANYCGGCNAEFYDEQGYAVCQGPASCAADSDCPVGNWCRQAAPESNASTAPARYECVPFAAEGASCNGFTLPWSYERCAPGLVCDTPDLVADAPGVCRRSCQSDADCMRTGCSGQICAAEPVVTTCEWRNEYACYADPAIATCACQNSLCGWAQTTALQQCLDTAGVASMSAL